MKMNIVKCILALLFAGVAGTICYYIAPQTDQRQWISLGVTCVTTAIPLLLAMGMEYQNGNRNMNIKLVAWLNTVFVIISNVVFSCFNYPILIYIAINILLAAIGFIVVYSMQKK